MANLRTQYQNNREYERTAISSHSFPVNAIVNLRGTNYVGHLWDFSPKGCAFLLKRSQVADISRISESILGRIVVLVTLNDTSGHQSKLNGFLKRVDYFSESTYLVAIEFTEILDESFLEPYLKPNNHV